MLVRVDILLYTTSFYGSSLWDLYSVEVERIFKSWNVTVRNVLRVPWQTHGYLIETISNCAHPKTLLCSRYVKFTDTLTTSPKSSVRYLAKLNKGDLRTLLGRTLLKISKDCKQNVSDLTPALVKKTYIILTCPRNRRVEEGYSCGAT